MQRHAIFKMKIEEARQQLTQFHFFLKTPKPREKKMFSHLFKNHKAQNIIEYATVIALVSAAMVLMSTYVFRSVQAAQKQVEQSLR